MKFSDPFRTDAASRYNALFASGELVALATAYPGLDRGAAITAGDVIARFDLPATPFTESSGVLTLAGVPLTEDAAINSGTIASAVLLASGDDGSAVAGATHERVFLSAGPTGGTVDLSGVGGSATAAVEVAFDNAAVVASQEVRVESLTIDHPEGDREIVVNQTERKE